MKTNTCKLSSNQQSPTEKDQDFLLFSSELLARSQTTQGQQTSNTFRLEGSTIERSQLMFLLEQLAGLLPCRLPDGLVLLPSGTRVRTSDHYLIDLGITDGDKLFAIFSNEKMHDESMSPISADVVRNVIRYHTQAPCSKTGKDKAKEWFNTTPSPQAAKVGRW